VATNSNDGGSPFNRGIQHEAKQSAILSRAAKLFNTKGARATTLSDVANKLGLTKTSLYYYVKTKEDLIFQCYDASMKHALRSLDEIEQETDDPLERTLRFMQSRIDSILQALQGNADYYAAPLELASLKPQHRDALTAEYLEMFKRVRAYIREGIEAGSIRPCHSTTTTRALIGALDWSFYWLYEIPREEAEKASAAVADICANGLLSLSTDFVSCAHRIRPEAAPPAGGFDREAQNRLKQEAFFKAGTRFFNRKGFTGTSLDEIAEYLQVSKGAFYYHFANKESLLTQCYDYSLDQLQAIYNEVLAKEQPATAKLDEICRRIFSVQNSDLGPLIRYNTITALPPPIRRRVLARTEKINDHIGDIIRDGQAKGEFRPANALVAQNMLQGAINASMDIAQWRQVDDLDATAIEYFDVFQFGLAADRR
jgi:AcrR family transcriptional regulator